jgi:hypothetical protein
MTQKMVLWSIGPKDVMTSLLSLLMSHRGKIYRVSAKENNVYIGILPVELSSEKLMRYRELCIWCTMVLVLTKSFKNKCVILGQELTENNLRKWRVRSSAAQRIKRAGSSFTWASFLLLVPGWDEKKNYILTFSSFQQALICFVTSKCQVMHSALLAC